MALFAVNCPPHATVLGAAELPYAIESTLAEERRAGAGCLTDPCPAGTLSRVPTGVPVAKVIRG
ncbi:hypothetical protein [Saccharopolyspora spinosa]|uniref:hypothetical protein n=1 Tax=Saccharopolyspora spinosa TaxID=60894 RepID=UPI0002379545|nr:hypothetical protein [Saccharopolyspora spinosa]